MKPKKLYCLDRSENGLFFLDYELRQSENHAEFEVCIADILDTDKIRKLLDVYRPDLIFHAAAYKHVPLMEHHPEEAVRNNVMGTLNMMLLAEEYGAEKFILISTDKAVNPTSVMGATKRTAELILQSYSAKSRIKLVTVRFGNVLGSFGSVIPIFQQQIARGGPVTITHPGMKRFFMTIPESVKLILEAARMGNSNEIFVLDMGEPIKLINIARRLIKLSGFEPDKDIQVKVVGTRPGEKIEEELWNKGEVPVRTSHRKIMMAMGNHYNHWDLMDRNIRALDAYANEGNVEKIYETLHRIIPEFCSATARKPLPDKIGSPVRLEQPDGSSHL
jgi:FlaA1/EpsC-like NDP-sugar epimerase